MKDLRGSRCQKRSSTIRGTSTTRKELLGEVRAAVSELIYPTEKHWLRERDELFEREIERKHDIIINKAMRGPRWEIVEEDVEETEKYYAKAARDRTRAGPTGVMGGMITLGGNQMREAMGLKLEMIASCGKRPAHWREAIMILALKPERPEQNIRGSYRPITVQEIPAKGVEAALARYYDELLRANPLHPMVMAYRENMSIGIALFAMTETCLHAQESKRRVVMIFTDIKNFFNTLWKKLVEVLEWERLKLRGQLWELVRQWAEGVRYRADFHGHMTEPVIQEEGLAQGALLSPKKANLISGLMAEEMEGRGRSPGGGEKGSGSRMVRRQHFCVLRGKNTNESG